ncbi:MAG: flagellar hook-associated protein FlgK [candidate division Zixibacteria bacterium]|nr:flagellar hook-associated protein FlgK [candidate division Zixibacteria bacterium]
MYGINVGLEIGKRALLSQQFSLNVTGHNIANVNTPGYTRQQAMMQSTLPMRSAQGDFGTGVEVVEIRRLRTRFLDEQYRQESESLGRWATLAQGWGQVERIYTEPSDTGFSSILDNFWNSWQDLATNPDSQAARVAVKEQGSLVVNAMHHFTEQLRDFQRSIDEDIQTSVTYVNNVANQIAALNDSIASAELTGHIANDLRDRRDYLVDELATFVNVEATEESNGNFAVRIGGMALVDGNTVSELETVVQEQGINVVSEVKFVNSNAKPEIINGSLSALIETRDEVISGRQQELDELALAIVEQVNQYHSEGYGMDGNTGRNFFDAGTTGAADIELDDLIEQNEGFIASSLNGEIGDNSNALRIAGLRGKRTMNSKSATFGDFYNSMIGTIGVRTREAQNLAENQASLVFHIENNRQALEGVSLDEEMTNMIKFEHAYEAAARVITAMDEALNTIINGMGLVGR